MQRTNSLDYPFPPQAGYLDLKLEEVKTKSFLDPL
jgi:hypothetical protein